MSLTLFKFLLVQYCGLGNRLQNLTDGLFTIFTNVDTQNPDKGYYLASVAVKTKDKNGNDMYIVELKSKLPNTYVPNSMQNYDPDNSAFYVALNIITPVEMPINVYFFRLLNAISQKSFADGQFQVKKVKKIYDLVTGGDLSNYVLEHLKQIFKEVQFLVTRNASLYFPQLLEAVSTPQDVTGVTFKLHDIDGILKKYIKEKDINYISIPVVYSNLEQDTLSLDEIVNSSYCTNCKLREIRYGNTIALKFVVPTVKCG